MEFSILGESKPFIDDGPRAFEEVVRSLQSSGNLDVLFEPIPSAYYPGESRSVEEFSTGKEYLKQNLLFDVYISKAEDTSSGFTAYLEKISGEKGLSTCKDNLEAIAKSRIFILVLSNGYASSPFALDELVEMMKVAEANRRRILPVFYHVSPSDVRYQIGSYGKALAAHQKRVLRETFDKWIKAMKDGAGIVGWHIERGSNKFEYVYIEEILQEVSKHVACIIGLHTRMQEVVHHLDSKSDGVCVLVISGVLGIGKSTLAREVYHYRACNEFNHRCFVDKAGEYLNKHGLEGLLSTIVGEKNIESEHVKGVLKQKKIFSIIEDVDDPKQLKAIVELSSSLASGSKVVIITAHDYDDLPKIPGIDTDKIYKMKKLNDTESYEFLCLKMFKSRCVKVGFVSVIKRAATCGAGLPFLLELIGSTLAGKEKKECQIILDKFENIPNGETREILKVCLDALEEHLREILIHIAGNLREKQLNVVEDKLQILFGSSTKDNIEVLRDKSFIKINERNQVTLHDLTREMVKD